LKPTPKPPSPRRRPVERDWFESGGSADDIREQIAKEKRAAKKPPSPRALVRACRAWASERRRSFRPMGHADLSLAVVIDTYEKRLKTAKGGRRK